MNRKFSTNSILFYCVLIVLPGLAGCSKSIKTMDDPKFMSLSIYAKTIDALQLKVTAGDEILTQSIVTPDGQVSVTFLHTEPEYRFGVYDVFTHQAILDTLVSINTIRAGGRKIVLLQSVPGGEMVWVGPPPASETLPTSDSTKMSIVYTLAALPDQVKVVVENSIGNTNNYHATDSFLLQKGEFSHYFTGNRTSKGKLQLKFYTPDSNRTLVAAITNDFNRLDDKLYVFAFRTGKLSNGVYSLTAENLY
ncbi:hypothetical protein HB364_15515 [Pseudoflavitalea sp. X16]|uniref:hypothetical protein n=1 Tax=Paraflavitalea devenefica TaxID=2716334 RepID=UPI001424346A|nr:hypothetical protein [Paraflavitalea devenefica]NII26497.1 hypothetical protein [Paraflavitalea devenefica]